MSIAEGDVHYRVQPRSFAESLRKFAGLRVEVRGRAWGSERRLVRGRLVTNTRRHLRARKLVAPRREVIPMHLERQGGRVVVRRIRARARAFPEPALLFGPQGPALRPVGPGAGVLEGLVDRVPQWSELTVWIGTSDRSGPVCLVVSLRTQVRRAFTPAYDRPGDPKHSIRFRRIRLLHASKSVVHDGRVWVWVTRKVIANGWLDISGWIPAEALKLREPRYRDPSRGSLVDGLGD